ncbi:MAG: Cys-tRNA(Pro) deacylase [Spirochaetales bacterium]|nr:Cys-tRNA(Pro) deacylase [Spirochaetales bacterium]
MQTKTNAIRLLERSKLPFELFHYEVDESDLSAGALAAKNGLDIDRIFKTLVLRTVTGELFVCVIPGSCELNLKKAAAAMKSKKVEMIAVKELLPLTGYIRGGCSPLGMKKAYPTLIDETCHLFPTIYVSAGVRGTQILLSPEDLIDQSRAEAVDLV